MEANSVRKELRYGDEDLARAVSAGDDEAFEILFQRHQPPILAFCRHMLGRPHDAQDATQHTFLTAYRVLRAGDAPVTLRSWLFAVARNRCISMLRARREQVGDDRLMEVTTDGLAGQVQDRADLRALLRDVADLPDDQRAALLLAEIGDVSHQEIAGVIGVRREKVKALVFQARRALMAARDARDTPCLTIQQELATARGAALRRAHLRRHLHVCPSCREFREALRIQRDALAVVLPVAPALLLDRILGGSAGATGGHAGAAGSNGATAGGHVAVPGSNGAAAGANGAAAGGHAGAVGGHAAAVGANAGTLGANGAAVGASTAAAGGQAAAVGANAVSAGVTAVLKAAVVKVGVGVVAAGGIAAGGTIVELPQVTDADTAAARNAPVTVAASPRTAAPPRWTPTSGERLAGSGAGDTVALLALGPAEGGPLDAGGELGGPAPGRPDSVERGSTGQPEHARAKGRGPGPAAAERGPNPNADEPGRGGGPNPNSTDNRGKAIGARNTPERGPGANSRGKGPKPKGTGGPATKPGAANRGPNPRSTGGARANPKRAGNGPNPARADERDAEPKPGGTKSRSAGENESDVAGDGATRGPSPRAEARRSETGPSGRAAEPSRDRSPDAGARAPRDGTGTEAPQEQAADAPAP